MKQNHTCTCTAAISLSNPGMQLKYPIHPSIVLHISTLQVKSMCACAWSYTCVCTLYM